MNPLTIIVPTAWNALDLVVPAALAVLSVALCLIGRHRDRRAVRVRWVPRSGPEADGPTEGVRNDRDT